MLRTAVLRTPWQHVPTRDFAQLVTEVGLEGMVVDGPAGWTAGSIESHFDSGTGVAAIRVGTLTPADFVAASHLLTQFASRVLVVRPVILSRPSEYDLTVWRELGAWAANRNVTIAVDLGGSDTFDARAMWQFVRDVGHEQIRLCFDLGSYASSHPFSHWEVALQRVVAHLGVVWLSDWSGTSGDTRRPLLGEGTIDFLRVAEIVRTFCADALAVVDVGPSARARGTVEECEQALAQSVAQLRRCGWFDR